MGEGEKWNSDQFPAAEFPLTFPVAGADRFQERMELTAVIHVTQMAKLMEHHVIPQFGRETHQIEIQIDIPAFEFFLNMVLDMN